MKLLTYEYSTTDKVDWGDSSNLCYITDSTATYPEKDSGSAGATGPYKPSSQLNYLDTLVVGEITGTFTF